MTTNHRKLADLNTDAAVQNGNLSRWNGLRGIVFALTAISHRLGAIEQTMRDQHEETKSHWQK